jgi:hypothetical protein
MALRRIYRLTVFVPADAAASLKLALARSGELTFGNYADVIWTSSPGDEQFRPLPAARPTLGETDRLTRNASIQLVFSIPFDASRLERVIAVVVEHHPWEEPVIYIDECYANQACGAEIGEQPRSG